MTITTETIAIRVDDDSTMSAHLARPDRRNAETGVVVAHELFGVSPDIIGVVDDLAAAGHLAIAPEFYHRDSAPGQWFDRDDDGRCAGFAQLHRMNRRDALADVAAAIEHLRGQPGIRNIAMIGFSAGGHLAYLAASRLPIAATAVLYGGWLPSTQIPLGRPQPTLSLTPQIAGRMLLLVGEDDALIDADQRAQIRSALESAAVDHSMITYPGVQHAYFWPGTPAFDRAARDDSWRRILELLGGRERAESQAGQVVSGRPTDR